MNADTLRTRFGQVIRRRRLTTQVGQEALAALATIHRTHLSLIERGERMPTINVVHLLAQALNTTMADLLTEVESEGQQPEEPPPMPRGRPRKKDQEG